MQKSSDFHLPLCHDDVVLQVDRFGIYKVETIGDSYMAVAGANHDMPACFKLEALMKAGQCLCLPCDVGQQQCWSVKPAGHDEDASRANLGRPADRMLQMACAMLDVADDLTMLDGSKVQIRIGMSLP